MTSIPHNIKSSKNTIQSHNKSYLKNETLADPPCRMIRCVLLLGEIPGSNQRNGDRVPNTIWIAVEVTGARSNGQSSLSSGKCKFISQAPARALLPTDVTATRYSSLARAQGTRRRISSVDPDLLKSTTTSRLETMPMSP